ncbi:CHAT domain-containing protein [Pseudenhygromyxa sp. WMMC2535]|uniref:CHAT domain-containing protein n=1 Tax=Pseudenhygromyxa sp. WMMC2535 TaxID=2712867 RepID=UPI0015542F4B|nr:CHAT domain-containing protein [Pseudenhygromyxa sp. WMMC2535]NVB38092.1 CHAT domain-containing protein [Pseudenhygromyxa sp. WMMC2535]
MTDDIRTVPLELLRLGPPHNQLLSPLTRYLGVCGNHRAEEVSVPWEHRDFAVAIEALRYTGVGEQDRLTSLVRLGSEVTGVIARVEGLKNVLSAAAAQAGTLIQLELVISASELAMLPFELTRTFPGGPGSDEQFLVIQPAVDVEVTRRVRGIEAGAFSWPTLPKILFIAAQPEGMEVPRDAHLQALMGAIQPYLGAHEDTPEALFEAASPYLRILPAASIDEIQRTCAAEHFSYVHVLAHGLQDPSAPGAPFGLALHAGPGLDQLEVVSGERLAAALRASGQAPAVVTVAACDSGNVTEVVHNGASLAHALHCAGLPFVTASQFPLSFEGSIELVEQLYQRLPQGEDPRRVTHDLRRRLYASYAAQTHDWASLVVYAALPVDIGDQLRRVRYQSARRRLDALMERLDHRLESRADPGEGEGEDLRVRVGETLDLLPCEGEWKIEAEGLRGSVRKRLAQIDFMAGLAANADDPDTNARRERAWSRSVDGLRRARDHYREAARQSLLQHTDDLLQQSAIQWLLIQDLCLSAVLGEAFDRHRWSAALVSTLADLEAGTSEVQTWALSSLVELHVLLLAWPGAAAMVGVADPASEAHQAAARLAEHGTKLPLVVTLTRRQLDRYGDWLWSPALLERQAARGIVRELSREGSEGSGEQLDIVSLTRALGAVLGQP